MRFSDFKAKLREELLDLPAAAPTDNGVVIRCDDCGDSIKSIDHGHLHIWIDIDNDDIPLIYHCFRCDESGILSASKLRNLGIEAMGINNVIGSYNRKQKKRMKKIFKGRAKLDLTIPKINNVPLANKKFKYINDRFGSDLTIDDCKRFKIVPNLGEFLKANNLLENVTDGEMNLIKSLHQYGVGFLTTENHFVNIRSITNSKMRYYKYQIIKTVNDTAKMYIIPTIIDNMTTDDINIYIAEGTFDAIGVYLNVIDDHTNAIFCGCNGCGFGSVFEYFISLGFFGDNMHYHIMSDKDKRPHFYNKLTARFLPFVGSINLYYNKIGKDYGVRREQIELETTRIC